jgi:hypothetical protein
MIGRILTARKRPKEAESFSTPRQKEAAAPNVRDARLLRRFGKRAAASAAAFRY